MQHPGFRHETIDRLPAFFSWGDDDLELLKRACQVHVHWLYRRIAQVGYEAGLDLFRQVRALPLANQQRLLLAPVVGGTLSGKLDAFGLERLVQYLRIEEGLAKGAVTTPGWTAAGDYHFADAPPGSGLPAAQNVSYEAPKVRGMVIDTHCPQYRRCPEKLADVAPYERSDVEHLAQSVEQSLSEISAERPVVQQLICECARVITVVRSDDSMSFSHPSWIGHIGLANVHAWSLCKLMDALIHEATHAFLYRLELGMPFYHDEKAAASIKCTSPWTGRDLELHSFVHACFVWFGLWQFWRRKAPAHAESAKFAEVARSGFDKEPEQALSRECRSYVYADVLAAIDRLSALAK